MSKRAIIAMGILVFLAGVTGSVSAFELPPGVLREMARVAERSTQTIERSLEDPVASRDSKSTYVEKALNEAEEVLQAGSVDQPVSRSSEAVPAFRVEKVHVLSSQLLPQDVLAAILEQFEGREQTMQTMQDLADRITLAYRQRGYLSSQAYIPPQEMNDGIFKIAVLEGRIGRIIFEGNEHYSSDVLRRYCDIREGDVLSYQKLQQTVAKLNAHPDRIVRAIIRRGQSQGQTDIVFNVEERSLVAGSVLADDHGSKAIGNNRLGTGLRLDNVFGQDDIMRMGMMGGRNFGSTFIEHAFPLAVMNSVWKTGVAFSRSLPQKQYEPYGISTTTMDYWGRLETRLITDERLALDWKTGLDIRESRTKFLSGTDSRQRLRVLRFGPALTLRDDGGGTMIENQFLVGLSGLGAAVYQASAGRPVAQPNFFASDLAIQRAQKMPFNTRMSIQARGRLSPDQQPSSEQMAFGGADTVRGYPEDNYFADQGLILNVEYLIPFFFLPEAWKMPWSKELLRDRLDLAIFFDEGWAWQKEPYNDDKGSAVLSGTGIGLRARLANHIYFTTDLAWAVGDRPSEGDHRFRIHSGIQANF